MIRGLWGVLLLSLLPVLETEAQSTSQSIVGNHQGCVEGTAAGFACERVDLLSFLPISEIGGSTLVVDTLELTVTVNDVWGWTDPETGREYALVGRTDGTAFVDVTNPLLPVYLGLLPSHDIIGLEKEAAAGNVGQSPASKTLHDDEKGIGPWRDIKVYQQYALIVADASPGHGIQIFDLTQLRDVTNPPLRFAETAHYDRMGSAHNIAVNEDTGYAYAVGSSGGVACGGGLHMVDISDPLNPTFAGCFADPTTGRSGTGYTHDVQCVVYHGPDAEHAGKEICVGSNETAISIADVSDKTNPVALSTATYPEARYVHQGWFADDQRYFYQNDELDENTFGFPTRTIIWDLVDLDEPRVAAMFSGMTDAIDHNLYVVGDRLFQSNYKAGLRILDITQREAPVEIAYFDTYPAADNRGFDGSWSNYPFFQSGTVVVSSIREGLFVVRPTIGGSVNVEQDALPSEFALEAAYPNPFNPTATIVVRVDRSQALRVSAHDVLGRRVRELFAGILAAGEHALTFDADELPGGVYLIRAQGEGSIRTTSVTLAR